MHRAAPNSIELQPEQLELWAHKLESDTGVQLGQVQEGLLNAQIGQRMRQLQLQDADGYYARVCTDPLEWQTLLSQLLVKETQFFRNREALEGIKSFLTQRKLARELGNSVDVCSMGCATGEEAYSLAATLHSCLPNASGNHYFSVTGIDLCQQALASARQGIYPSTRLQQVTDIELARYFEITAEQQYRVKTFLSDRVTFVRGNLCDSGSLAQMPMDIIVCMNVLIYFRKWRRKALLNGLVPWLKPGGLLIIGSGELPGWQHEQMTSVAMGGVQAYQRLQTTPQNLQQND